MKKKKQNLPIILASTSPRRRDLLAQINIEFEVRVPTAEEMGKRGETPDSMVKRLSLEKGKSVIEEVIEDYSKAIIIASDTTVVAPNNKTVLGKPKNEAEARKMLVYLNGKTHTVHTGYSILLIKNQKVAKKISRAITTRVKMRRLSPATIKNYVSTGEPMDKAGSYAAQGIGMGFIEKITGSYSNVVGLPVSQLLDDLEKMGFKFIF